VTVAPTIDDDPGGEVLPPSLEGLVDAAVSGDPMALERLVTEVDRFVSRYCRSRLGHLVESADRIAEEVCLAVVNALPGSPVTGRSFRAYAYRVAAQRVDEALRSISRDRAHLPVERLTDRLGELLRELPPFQREALLLRIAVGMSVEETAQAVGSTPDAIRVAQHRALARLRGAVVGTDERDRSRGSEADDA
jgi:RNA polymerase sigma-70 factor, ECF subfamily